MPIQIFEGVYQNPSFDENADDDVRDEEDEDEIPERQESRLEIKHRISQRREIMRSEEVFRNLTGNLTKVRIPAPNEQGRYEYFHYGNSLIEGMTSEDLPHTCDLCPLRATAPSPGHTRSIVKA